MKNVKTIFASVILIVLVSFSAFAGTGSKIVAVINHATWCPACQENGERAQATFMENNKDGAIQFIANDLCAPASITVWTVGIKYLAPYTRLIVSLIVSSAA